MVDEYKCKGSHVIQARDWIDEKFGAGTFDREVQGAGPLWNGVYLPGSWYDVEPLSKAITAAAQRLGQNVEDVTMEIARLNALRDLTSIYRVFLRVAAPVRVMSFTPQLWRNYVHFGEARAVVNEPGHYLGECSGIPTHLLDWSCGAWRGFVPTAIELAGGKNARGTIVSKVPDRTHPQLVKIQCEVRYST